MIIPLVQEIPYQDPAILFARFANKTGAVFLDSAERRPGCGQYSYIAIEPFQQWRAKGNKLVKEGQLLSGNPFIQLQLELKAFPLQALPHLPPFQGGMVGYFGYELSQHLEQLPLAVKDDLEFPDLLLGFYDLVLAFDLVSQKAWIFSSGFPCLTSREREGRAKMRLNNLLQELELPRQSPLKKRTPLPINEIRENFNKEAYEAVVQKTINYILAGDIFEANLSQRYKMKLPHDFSAFTLYQGLRKHNPAPFAAFINFGDTQLISASPERFLKLDEREVESRPIKGTCRRAKNAVEDEALAKMLLASEKDRSENVMIVDLLRNDLSRVCESHTVKVPQLCGLESYATVHHLVSVVTGRLQKHLTAMDLLAASFPGGSITGAPKCRAMEIIAELEPTQRGPYCGSIAYIGFDGNMDSSITIRTFCVRQNTLSFQAGGAVVADSSPEAEYEEVLLKAKALFKVLEEYHDLAD